MSAAFNSVHRIAIQVATEQAALRKSIGDMFLNLARRSQSLIDRQLELIDDLERTRPTPTPWRTSSGSTTWRPGCAATPRT